MPDAQRLRVRVEGVVQGVGFRPFVHGIALRAGLTGHVGNDGEGVFIEIEGAPERLDAFLAALRAETPRLATIDRVTCAPMAALGTPDFTIVDSRTGGERRTGVTADSATCDDCLREMRDPADRRYRYPFVNCTNCGPRFTITRDVPYDRPFTTMSGFAMCGACAAEYHDPADRRFHAQPTCCPACGPRLALIDRLSHPLADPLAEAVRLLRDGGVLAVKGLGGYHLAADASSDTATGALRARKRREDKPFAVMVADLDSARELCVVDDVAADLLADRRRPIVLLDRRAGVASWSRLAAPVAPGNRQVGLILPYTPLHFLLLDAFPGPLVMTSGNVSDEPIAFADEDARARLAGIADAFLTHDRPIHTRADDSVARVQRGRPALIRRARGYAPEPLRLAREAIRPILACGAELKNTFCLVKGDRAVLSQHIGDLENYPTLRSYTDGIDLYSRLFDIKPELVAYDLHPEYLSTKHALALESDGLDAIGVQHHHAHIASCLADNGVSGPVIGVAYDGTGFGPDGTVWGGEILVADLLSYTRVGHFEAVPLPGGAAAIRQPWRMAASYLGDEPSPVRQRHADEWPAIVAMAERGVNAPLTSSVGRLFDAVSALLGVRDEIHYEGQAAIELEQRTDPHETGAYPASLHDGVIRGADLVRAAAADLARGTPLGVIAGRFHNGVVDATVRACVEVRARTGLAVVALSGGVFGNVLLATRLIEALEGTGFTVLTHSRVPCNDGGISFGQAAVAAATDRTDRRLESGVGTSRVGGGQTPGDRDQ